MHESASPNSDLHALPCILALKHHLFHMGSWSCFPVIMEPHWVLSLSYHSLLLTRQISSVLRVNKTTWRVASMLKIALTACACSRYHEESFVSGRKVVMRSVYQHACWDWQCSYIYAVARVMPGSIVPNTLRIDRGRCAGRNETRNTEIWHG